MKSIINDSNYKEIDYAEFSGSSSSGQAFNTGVTTLVYPWSIEITYEKTNTQTRDQCLVGCLQFSNGVISYGKFPNIYNGTYETSLGTTGANTAPNNTKTVICVHSYGNVDKNYNDRILGVNAQTASFSGGSLYIGAYHDTTATNAQKWWFSGKIYRVRIVSNGTLVRDFIPAAKYHDKAGSIAAHYEEGFWDLVTEKWYGNIGTKTYSSFTIFSLAGRQIETPVPTPHLRYRVCQGNLNTITGSTSGTRTGTVTFNKTEISWMQAHTFTIGGSGKTMGQTVEVPHSGSGSKYMEHNNSWNTILGDSFSQGSFTISSWSFTGTRTVTSGGTQTVVTDNLKSNYNTPTFSYLSGDNPLMRITAKNYDTPVPDAYDALTLTINYSFTDNTSTTYKNPDCTRLLAMGKTDSYSTLETFEAVQMDKIGSDKLLYVKTWQDSEESCTMYILNISGFALQITAVLDVWDRQGSTHSTSEQIVLLPNHSYFLNQDTEQCGGVDDYDGYIDDWEYYE